MLIFYLYLSVCFGVISLLNAGRLRFWGYRETENKNIFRHSDQDHHDGLIRVAVVGSC